MRINKYNNSFVCSVVFSKVSSTVLLSPSFIVHCLFTHCPVTLTNHLLLLILLLLCHGILLLTLNFVLLLIGRGIVLWLVLDSNIDRVLLQVVATFASWVSLALALLTLLSLQLHQRIALAAALSVLPRVLLIETLLLFKPTSVTSCSCCGVV